MRLDTSGMVRLYMSSTSFTRPFHNRNTVADFIVDEEWNVILLREHISAIEAKMVLQIPISRTGSTDKLVWHFDPKGQYTVNSGYKHTIALKSTRDVIDESSANPSSKFWKIIWHIPVQPKIKLFLWKAISNLISTKDNLFRRSFSPSPACPICNICVESVEHLLFECAWTRPVWFGSPICLRPPSPVFSAVDTPPYGLSVKLNCDTAFKLYNAAFGIVVRDSTGYLRYVLGNTCHAISHLHAEIIAVHYACSLASDRGWFNAAVESDSQLVVSLACSESTPPWSIAALVDDIRLWSNNMHLSFSWKSKASKLKNGFDFISNMPDPILKLILQGFKAAIMHKVKSLDLMYCPKFENEDITLPHYVISCDSLEVLRLCLYRRAFHFPESTSLRFRALRVLELESVNDMDLVEQFIRLCPSLEELTLIDCFVKVLDTTHASSPKLKTLIIRNCKDMYSECHAFWSNIDVECPELVNFEFVGRRGEILIEKADSIKKAVIFPEVIWERNLSPNLGKIFCELLAGISHVESLSINFYFIQCLNVARDGYQCFPALFPNLKTLEVTTSIDACTMNVLIRFLKCSPTLECLNLILQKVKFLGLSGEKQKLDIARCLLEHENALEEMCFSWCSELKYREKSVEMVNILSKFCKASSTVKLISILGD
nr:hypothetical protein [Tanacetum cinerariifolium]